MRIVGDYNSPKWAKMIYIGLVWFVFLWLIPNASKILLSDVYALSAKNTIATYGNKNIFNLSQWLEARRQLEQALSIEPDDPNIMFSMGQLNAIRGYKAKGSQSISKLYYEEASLFYERSLKIRPRDALTWVNLVIALDAIDSESTRLKYALEQAKKLTENQKYLAEVVSGIERNI